MRLFDYVRASQLMDEAGIDLVLVSSKHCVGYLSDYWHFVSDDYYLLWDTTVTHKTLVGLSKDEAKRAFLVPGASEKTTLGTGHGIGRVVHEPPYMTQKDASVLEAGMVVTLEPTVNFQEDGDIFISLEDQFLITENGAECLTVEAPLDLYLDASFDVDPVEPDKILA